MSKKHPIVVITGSSGAGTSTVKKALESIFFQLKLKSVTIEGDSFHRYDRTGMQQQLQKAIDAGENFSHFGAEANMFAELEQLFKEYSESGQGRQRFYLHNSEEAELHSHRLKRDFNSGDFTPWEPIESATDLLFYEGLHGLVKSETIDMPRYADFKVGVVPVVNLEWIQKIHRDHSERGYSEQEVIENILRRMPDYVKYITPQFSQTDINFQRVATVDTSNPFIARDIPTLDESFVVIRFKNPDRRSIDFVDLLALVSGSFMSRGNTIVVPGGKMSLAMKIIFTPIIKNLIEQRNQ